MKAATKPVTNAAVNPVTIPATIPEPVIAKVPCRVLKIASCPSLSGKSTLTYHVGYVVDGAANRVMNVDGSCSEDIQFRVFANTGMGFFSQEWVPLSVIQQEFEKVPAGSTITSFQLHPLFAGKSVNTPAFLFAALQSEGLVQRAKNSTRRYDRMDPAGFLAMVRALIASKVELKVDDSPSKTGAGATKNGGKPSRPAASPAKTGTRPAASASKIGAKTAKANVKSSNGVDITEIVEVINAKTGAKAEPAAPAKKSTAKTTSKPKA